MKAFINEYLQTIMYTICGLLLILGSYNIIINVNHFNYVNKRVVVSDIDSSYKIYKDNILEIQNNLSSYKGNRDRKIFLALSNMAVILKEDGLYRLIPGDEIGYADLYQLNTYFVETIINKGWISELKGNLTNTNYNQIIDYLVYNANYVNNELLDDSSLQYEVKKNNAQNVLNDEYHLIINNYRAFSDVILKISREMGG